MCGFDILFALHQKGYVINGAIPASFWKYNESIKKGKKNLQTSEPLFLKKSKKKFKTLIILIIIYTNKQ